MPHEYERFPRPNGAYYERRHNFITQGDIFVDTPWSQLGPTLILIDPPPEELPVPEGLVPFLQYGWTSGFGMVVSNTCDFRHPKASDIEADPQNYAAPGAVYHSGYVRVAPIFPLSTYDQLRSDEGIREALRRFDNVRRLFYLPQFPSGNGHPGLPESVAALHMTDLVNIDVLSRLSRTTQLSYLARQQLARKLVRFDTGYQLPYTSFDPDVN